MTLYDLQVPISNSQILTSVFVEIRFDKLQLGTQLFTNEPWHSSSYTKFSRKKIDIGTGNLIRNR